jgi:hypothetical protein
MYRTGFTCMNYLLRFGEEYSQYTCPAYMIKINQSNNISDPSEINLMYEFASRGKNFPLEQLLKRVGRAKVQHIFGLRVD